MIRRVRLPGLDVETSCLGFGCASLGSRVSDERAARALACAADAGVTWFDVAPAYGGGRAEALLGKFIQGRRSRIQICTKVGLRARRGSVVHRIMLPIARRLISAAPVLRGAARAKSGPRNESLSLSPALIASSIADSLAALRTDHVDVLALHGPAPNAVASDEVLTALRQILERGQARAVAVAGSEQAALVAADLGSPYSVVQLADPPQASPLADVRRAYGGREMGLITHSVFGVGGALAQARDRLRRDEGRRRQLRELGHDGAPEQVAAEVLLDRAFASNPDGVVLASMFGLDHLTFNVARASLPISAEALAAADVLLG